jgi:ABC-type glycerol-3-phosphate transport system substrate-binding protein
VTPDVDQQTETGNLGVYELGRASFLRGWPFVRQRLRDDAGTGRQPRAKLARSRASDTTRIVPLPPWTEGGTSVGILGGHNLVIPTSARHPAAALRLIDFMTSDSQIRKDEREDSQYPVLKQVADDLDLRNRDLVSAINATTVVPRPVIAQYFEVSEIISREVKEVLDHPDDDDGLAQTKLAEIQRAVQDVLTKDAR